MVGYGLPSTLSITADQMAAHAAAVVRVTGHACILVDMPFGSYQESPSQAFASAARMLAASGADGVQLEGGAALAPTTRRSEGRRVWKACGSKGRHRRSRSLKKKKKRDKI